MAKRYLLWLPLLAVSAAGQDQDRPSWREAESTSQTPGVPGDYLLKKGTRIPLTVLSTVSTRNATPGSQVYLRTMVPVAMDRRIVIPEGSHVTGTVVEARRPGKVKGRGELYLVFNTLLLPNGVTLDLTGGLGGVDGNNPGQVSSDEGKVTGPGGVSRDAMVAGGATMAGGWAGSWADAPGIGLASGAAAGLAAVLLTRGPDAELPAGSMVEMVLNRDLKIAEGDVPAAGFAAQMRPARPAPQRNQQQRMRMPGRWGLPRIF